MSKELNKATVEQAGTNVGHGHVFPRADGVKMRCGGPGLCSECSADASRARAALAQPSPSQGDEKPGDSILCYGCFAKGVGPEHFDEAGKCLVRQQTEPLGAEFAQVLSDNLPELLSTAQAEKAEGFTHFPELLESVQQMDAMLKANSAQPEQPEVVGYLLAKGNGTLSILRAGSSDEPVMTVAQHERIVGELRAVIAQLRQHKNDYMDAGQETYRALQNEIREREAEIARLDGLVSGRTAERDAAPVAQAPRSDHSELRRIAVALKNPLLSGDEASDLMVRYEALTMPDHIIALIDSQALHSVPEASEQEKEQGWTLDYRFVERVTDLAASRTEYTTSMEATEQVLLAARELLAAAPGKSVPQAWLDVQVERRRQIEAEGWTPEHDDEHDSGELAAAGAAYALHAADHLNPYSQGDGGDEAPSCWPWHDGIAGRGEGPEKTEPAWWKPSTPRRDMVKAGALILAEIERLDRAAPARR